MIRRPPRSPLFPYTTLFRSRPEPPRGGADVPDDRERRLARPIALDPRSHPPGRPAAAALSARGRPGIRARADVSPDRGHAGRRARGHGAGAEEFPAARARGRGKARPHRRAARRLVCRIHGRPAGRRVDRLRRQPRGAPDRGGRRRARLGRHDGRARSRAARARQAGPHRAGLDRPANRIAWQHELRGRSRAAVRAGLRARRARALLRPPRRRGRSGRCHRRAREELARSLVLPMRYALALAAFLAGCATAPGPAPTPAPEPDLPPVQIPEPAPVPAPTPALRSENVAIAGLMDTARADAAAGRVANAAATLERALRIEPRNPRLWHELARVRLKQGQYAQAESVAARSSSWAGSDNALRAVRAAAMRRQFSEIGRAHV